MPEGRVSSRAVSDQTTSIPSRPLVACLVPVRNGARDLRGWLASARRFADVVVALDDGSTDRTFELLSADPLVRTVLRNPKRDGFGGWDDAVNRRRLLEACGELRPEWVVWLDVDERLEAGDARALRELLETDAIPGCAYGFQHYRMWGRGRCDPAATYVWRAFAWMPELMLPPERLHFDPVPAEIPRAAWIPTTIRVQHLASANEARRAARLRKYAEADPAGEYPTNFGGLDDVPATTVPWPRRPAGLPALVPVAELERTRDLFADPEADAGRPLLAVLLPVRNGERDLPGWLDSVRRFGDAVVALDDGSTDGTPAMLEAEPLVRVLLRNPPREGHTGWDDAANRQRLLDGAGEVRPRWVLFLDADERIDEGDAAAMRSWLEDGGAQSGDAYGFLVHRMTGDLQAWDRAGLWAFRLFAWRPGLRLPGGGSTRCRFRRRFQRSGTCGRPSGSSTSAGRPRNAVASGTGSTARPTPAATGSPTTPRCSSPRGRAGHGSRGSPVYRWCGTAAASRGRRWR